MQRTYAILDTGESFNTPEGNRRVDEGYRRSYFGPSTIFNRRRRNLFFLEGKLESSGGAERR